VALGVEPQERTQTVMWTSPLRFAGEESDTGGSGGGGEAGGVAISLHQLRPHSLTTAIDVDAGKQVPPLPFPSRN
jgi:hypothetical protein